MKICPKCNKSNPDNSKKCFFCNENLSNISPFVPKTENIAKEEKKDNYFEPENLEEKKDFESIDQPEENKQKNNIHNEEKKKLKKKHSPLDYINILFPIFSIVIFAITIFICVCIIIDFDAENNILKGIIYASFVFVGGSLFSIGILWLNAIIYFFNQKLQKNTKKL